MSSKKKQVDDERFQRVQKDPRFWEMPARQQKVKIDKRFQSMFHDKQFQVKYTVDKRGRPISRSSTEDLKRFYQLSDSSSEEEDEEQSSEERKKKKVRPERVKTGTVKAKAPEGGAGEGDEEEDRSAGEDDDEEEDRSADEDDDDDEEEDRSAGEDDDEDDDLGNIKEEEEENVETDKSKDEESGLDSGDDSDSEPDLARGRGNIETSSDDDDDEDNVHAILRKEEEEIEHDWGELCKDAQRGDEVSSRLAVCNMDWDRMKARDLLVLFSSFVPKGGAVLSVKIYPSEFGKERLKLEETQGPLELKALPDDSEDDTEEERVLREKLRDYQFKRLKYFYAVVELDSVETAAKIYEECDGLEYESSCSLLDLRFVPDDVTFEDQPRDEATDVHLSSYTPKLFTSSAASTSKVQLTWDETDHDRVTALNRTFNKNELLDMDFKVYLASSSEEDEEQEMKAGEEGTVREVEEKPSEEEEKKKVKKRSEEQINKYRELLKSIQNKEKTLQEDKDMEMEITWVPGLKEKTEQLVKKKLEGKDQQTPWEEYLQKKKEKKKRRSERKQEAADEEFSDDELPPDVDLSDPFFTAERGASDVKKKKKDKKKKQEEQKAEEEEEEEEKQKAEMVLLMEDDDAAAAKHKHFNYEKIVEQQNLSRRKRKKLLKKGEELLEEDEFQVDLQDPRFQAVFTSHLFNLDPSHPSFKKTRATQSILQEKQRRREEEQRHVEEELGAQKATPTRKEAVSKQEAAETRRENDSVTTKKAMDPSLSLLVKSIKNKTEQFQARKKKKLLLID